MRKKTRSKKSLEQDCLELWSKCVRTRDRVCRICGSDERLQAHHIRSRSNKSTYLDLQNGMALCAHCHILQKFNPERFQDRVLEVIGQEAYERLKLKSQVIWKPTSEDLQAIREKLSVVAKQLDSDFGILSVCQETEEVGI